MGIAVFSHFLKVVSLLLVDGEVSNQLHSPPGTKNVYILMQFN